MQHGTLNTAPTDSATQPGDIARSVGAVGADPQFNTSVVDIIPRDATGCGKPAWNSSVQDPSVAAPEEMQLFVDLHRSNPEACHRLAGAATELPQVGTELLGFRLRAELGRGAFGRVYLAEQDDLANRMVVLKVTPTTDNEPRMLAKLQHTNIVPIYSVHRAGPIQATCMPYLGSTTLEHVSHELSGRPSLPQSGKELISTLTSRKRLEHLLRESTSRPTTPESGEEVKNTLVIRKRTVRDGEALAGVGGSVASGCVEEAAVAQEPPEPMDAGLPPSPFGVPAHLELLQKFSFVEAVLWIGSRLADGLAHAHERGILHRDLKPANILLTDDGQPMLLDFNLAQDTNALNSADAAQAGGTLPFMPPEQLEAFRTQTVHLDCRSDIYSLGVVLCRVLTGQAPFPQRTGTVKEILEQMIRDRLALPRLRHLNPAISPAVESILRHCLEPDAARRYQNARQLKEDLERQLEHLPLHHAPEPSVRERLGKWRRRHPYLASTTTVAVVVGLVFAALLSLAVVRGQELAARDARQNLHGFLEGKKGVQYLLTARTDDPTQIGQGVQRGRELLGTYGSLDDGAWPEAARLRRLSQADQDLVRKNGGELFLLLARGVVLQAVNERDPAVRQELLAEALRLNKRAEACGGAGEESRALWQQRAELAGLLGRAADAEQLQERARATPLRTPADNYLAGAELAARGYFHDALPLLEEVTDRDPQAFSAWLLRGVCHEHLSQAADALACYSTCVALEPDAPWAYLNRGLTYLRQQKFEQAVADFDRVVALRPSSVEAYQHRAAARQGLQQYAEAVTDLDRALQLGAPPTNIYFLRAAARERAGDLDGAKQDRAEGLRRPPTDEMGWLTRGYARANADPKAALDDFDQALKLNARSLAALQNKAHILSKLGHNEEAVQVLDKSVEAHPDFIPARAGRGVLLARLGKRDAAQKDAVDCLARDNKPLTLYQLAGIYALTSEKFPDDRAQAFRLLSIALQKGVGFDLLETDKDLEPIRSSPEFQKLVDAARAIRAAATSTKNKN